MNVSDLENSATNLNNFSLDSEWSGSASELQNELLHTNVASYIKCVADVRYYQQILTKKAEYEDICTQLLALYEALAACSANHDDPDCSCSCAANAAKILELENQRQALRTEIISLLSIFTNIEPDLFIPNTDLRAKAFQFKILFDVEALVKIYSKPGKLKKTPPGFGLFDLYNQRDEKGKIIPYSGEAYVNEQIAKVVSQCRNEREIAVNVSLLFAKLAADKGYSLTYENPGANGSVGGWEVMIPGTDQYVFHLKSKFNSDIVYDVKYNNVTQVEEGMDCCAWVSYALNVAKAPDPTVPNPEGFAWKGVGGLNKIGEKVPPSEVKPGDIFIAPSPGNEMGHTGIIVGIEENPNQPGSGKVIVAESGGSKKMFAINEYQYSTNENDNVHMYTGGTTFRNLDSVYNS